MADDAMDDEPRETQQTREVEEWARPAYNAIWRDYLAAGAPYGRSHDGWYRWVLEQVQLQRAAYEASLRGPSFVARMVAGVARMRAIRRVPRLLRRAYALAFARAEAAEAEAWSHEPPHARGS